ncbi:MAG: ThuA domain-containing protein [Planctomycetes bacterium]|nr:ThuA domain-containing protein [Planctomycetota bacterium]
MLQAAAVTLSLFACAVGQQPVAADPWVVYEGGAGVGAGARVVFVTGDEEYRSEQGMPQLARILARLGCHCTVLFAIDPATGAIDPGVRDNIPGLEALDDADLMVLFTRFRDLPDAQMRHIVDYVQSGRPIVALRTATHAFAAAKHTKYADWSWNGKQWDGGFGRQVLGETWIAHHGAHGSQSTRGVVAPGAEDHVILRGIAPGAVWDPADVYAVGLPLPAGCEPVLLGEVLAGMTPDSEPAPATTDASTGAVQDLNAPRMPVAWTNTYRAPNGRAARVFATTLGSSQAFLQAGTRRLLVNACLWALGREAAITPDLDVSLAGAFAPTPFGFGTHQKGVRPADLAWRPTAAPAAK